MLYVRFFEITVKISFTVQFLLDISYLLELVLLLVALLLKKGEVNDLEEGEREEEEMYQVLELTDLLLEETEAEKITIRSFSDNSIDPMHLSEYLYRHRCA